mmetsp:Transcript_42643/g.89484  ORF Transcript_42643/g.89484 Transcript_42643/m.89484 type:complete len:405 (+) Transcript_42643:705-1919(+)
MRQIIPLGSILLSLLSGFVVASEYDNSIAVIGCGPGGAAFALTAEKLGLPITIYEDKKITDIDSSSYINVKRYGVDSLAEVEPKLRDMLYSASSNLSPRTEITNAAGSVLVDVCDPKSIALRRNQLVTTTLKCIKTPIKYGRIAMGVTQTADGVTVEFEGGKTKKHALAVLACGNRIRLLRNDLDVEPDTYVSWIVRYLPSSLKKDMPDHEICALGGSKHMIFSFPGEIALIAPYDLSDRSPEELQKIFEEQGFDPNLTKFISQTIKNKVKNFTIYRTDVAKNWFQGRVVGLGDAVHPMSPASARGATLAIQDGIELAECLAKQRDEEASILGTGPVAANALKRALLDYQRARKKPAETMHRIEGYRLKYGMEVKSKLGLAARDTVYQSLFGLARNIGKIVGTS